MKAVGKNGKRSMAKFLLSSLFICLILTSSAFARVDKEEVRLKQIYGEELNTNVPFFLRYSFLKQNSMDWKDSNYSERKEFLAKYDLEMLAEQKQEKADARAATLKERERLRQKRMLERQIAAELRQEKQEARETAQYYKNRQKALDDLVRNQQQELQYMEQQVQQQQLQNQNR